MAKKILNELSKFLEELQPLFYTPHIFSKKEVDEYTKIQEKLESRFEKQRSSMSEQDCKKAEEIISRIKKLVKWDIEMYKAEQKPVSTSSPNFLGIYK